MAVPHSIAINYRELYSEPTNNLFGTEEAGRDTCYETVYEVWRAATRALGVDVLLHNILSDFSRPIGGIGVFVPDGSFSSGVLDVLNAVASYVPDQARDRMKSFTSLGDVTGVDIATVAFDPAQLAVTQDVIMPGKIEWVLHLLAKEPGKQMMGPFKATDANVRIAKARSMAFIPFEMMEGVLYSRLTVYPAYKLIVPALVEAGVEIVCAPLVDFLTLTLVQPAEEDTSPLTVEAQVCLSGGQPPP
jgi:hypothetical protein